MYSSIDNTVYINGYGAGARSSAEYGRTAASNLLEYFNNSMQTQSVEFPDISNVKDASNEEFNQKMADYDTAIANMQKAVSSMPPVNFKYQYTPEKSPYLNRIALMGAAYQEMGARTSVSVAELDKKFNDAGEPNLSSQAGDINGDGQIDLGEYAASIVLADSLDGVVDGEISSQGLDASAAYSQKTNWAVANNVYRAIYYNYGLKQAQDAFLSDPNNIK